MSPYYLAFGGSITGIKPVIAATTRPVHLFIVWGVHIAAVVPFVLAAFSKSRVTREWRWMSGTALFISLAPYVVWVFLSAESGVTQQELAARLLHVLPLAALVAAAVYAALWASREDGLDGRTFALVLSGLGLLLILGPELLYLGDSFNTRMKHGVQALLPELGSLLSIGAGYTVYYWGSIRGPLSGGRRFLSTAWAGAFAVLLVGSLYYAPAGRR